MNKMARKIEAGKGTNVGQDGRHITMTAEYKPEALNAAAKGDKEYEPTLAVSDLPYVGPRLAQFLIDAGYNTPAKVAHVDIKRLSEIVGLPEGNISRIVEAARKVLAQDAQKGINEDAALLGIQVTDNIIISGNKLFSLNDSMYVPKYGGVEA